MSKFSWDDYPDFDVVAMDDDGEVNVYEGEVYRSDGDYSWWNEFGTDVLKIFAPAKQVDHGRVEPVYKPNLPPDWWFEDESGEGQTTDEERFDAEGLADHVSGVDSNTYAVGSLDSTGLEWDSRGGQKEIEESTLVGLIEELRDSVDPSEFTVTLNYEDWCGGYVNTLDYESVSDIVDRFKSHLTAEEIAQLEHGQYIGAPGATSDQDSKGQTWMSLAEAKLVENTYRLMEQDFLESHNTIMRRLANNWAEGSVDPYKPGVISPEEWSERASTYSLNWSKSDSTASDSTFPQDSPSNLARQAIWAHFEEFECLPDFLVGPSEVLGDFFMGIKVIDDGEA